MKKLLLLMIFFTTLLLAVNKFHINKAYSDQLDDLTKQIANLQSELDASQKATAPLESQLNDLENQLKSIDNQVAAVENDIAIKKQNIAKEYTNLAQKQQLFDVTVRNSYIKSYTFSPLLIFFTGNNASNITKLLVYQKRDTEQDKNIITNIALQLVDLEQQKTQLESEETTLASAKVTLDKQRSDIDKIVTGAKAYQAQLSTQIAALSAQQQQLLAQKYASLGIPLTAYTSNNGCSSDLTNGRSPGFSPAFGFFTYGVYHRVGMNQYGAKGRADKGQGYQQILSFYYPNTQIVNIGTSTNITVNGTNDYGETFSNQQFNIEDYLTHIYEMPSGWNSEALKAQAIAARTYAYKAVQSGQTTVAPNQSFQEVKTEQNAQAWIDAVNATSGQVLESGGQPITAWFSSTGGGYTHNSGDVFGGSTSYTTTTADANGSINSFSDLTTNAYDGPNYANSPWFYCDWGGRSQYNNTAWLQSSEVADIVNVIILAQADNSTAPHLSQPDGNVPDTWDQNRVKQELQNRHITPFNNISSVSVSPDFGSGRVTSVNVNGDAGSKTFSGDTFVTYFDVRAPANIYIPFLAKKGDGSYAAPLFNVETK
jgi:peptidoglycan hydrolase-like amidase/peptidoglycan hydrolase CwlO-like protein